MDYSFDGTILLGNIEYNLKLKNIPYGFDEKEKFFKVKIYNKKFNDNAIIIKCKGMNKPIACYLVDYNNNLEQCSFCSGKKYRRCDRHYYCYKSYDNELGINELYLKSYDNKSYDNELSNNELYNNKLYYNELFDEDELFFILRDIKYYEYYLIN